MWRRKTVNILHVIKCSTASFAGAAVFISALTLLDIYKLQYMYKDPSKWDKRIQIVTKREEQEASTPLSTSNLPGLLFPTRDSVIQEAVRRGHIQEAILNVRAPNGHAFRFARWKHPSVDNIQTLKSAEEFFTVWNKIIPKTDGICVDVGAHIGDTAVFMAIACKPGSTIAFEMGPPYAILQLNAHLNPGLNITAMNVAITNKNGMVHYQSGCEGCNGGIDLLNQGKEVQGRELISVLTEKYGSQTIGKVKFIKMDAEGFDMHILRSLKLSTLYFKEFSPIIWVEWYRDFKNGDNDACSPKSKMLFASIRELGYQIYQPVLPLTLVEDCTNKNYVRDLLLLKLSHIDSILNLN